MQRFTLDSYAVLSSIGMLILLAISFVRRRRDATVSLAILSLYFLVDNGGGANAEKPSAVRYLFTLALFLIFAIRTSQSASSIADAHSFCDRFIHNGRERWIL